MGTKGKDAQRSHILGLGNGDEWFERETRRVLLGIKKSTRLTTTRFRQHPGKRKGAKKPEEPRIAERPFCFKMTSHRVLVRTC